MTELAIFKNSELSVKDRQARAAQLINASGENTTGGDEFVFLNFSGQGAHYKGWTIGRDREEVDPDATYVIYPDFFTEGWICWKANNPVGKHSWSVYDRDTDKAIDAEDLDDLGPFEDGEGWQFELGLSLFDVDNPTTRIVFKTSTVSGRDSIAKMFKEVGDRTLAGEPSVPVIKLSSEVFEVKGKKNGKPLFPQEGWVSDDEVHTFMSTKGATLEELLAGKYTSKK